LYNHTFISKDIKEFQAMRKNFLVMPLDVQKAQIAEHFYVTQQLVLRVKHHLIDAILMESIRPFLNLDSIRTL